MSTLQAKYPYYLNNKAVYANEDLEVTDKYTGEVATRCALHGYAARSPAVRRPGLGFPRRLPRRGAHRGS